MSKQDAQTEAFKKGNSKGFISHMTAIGKSPDLIEKKLLPSYRKQNDARLRRRESMIASVKKSFEG